MFPGPFSNCCEGWDGGGGGWRGRGGGGELYSTCLLNEASKSSTAHMGPAYGISWSDREGDMERGVG